MTFLQNELIRKDAILKTLLETQTSVLETVSKPSVEEEEEVSTTRNEKLEEIQWQKQSSGKKNEKAYTKTYILKTYTLEILALIPKLMIFMNYLV